MEIFLYLLAIVAYFVPFYIALNRNIEGKGLILGLNIILGWTFVAWVLLIIAALSMNQKSSI